MEEDNAYLKNLGEQKTKRIDELIDKLKTSTLTNQTLQKAQKDCEEKLNGVAMHFNLMSDQLEL